MMILKKYDNDADYDDDDDVDDKDDDDCYNSLIYVIHMKRSMANKPTLIFLNGTKDKLKGRCLNV